jgi:antitoxin (DNA-binding transcriptional repressor) of toxin-antitoxin stability system
MIVLVSLSEAQERLPELVRLLASGDEVLITEGDEPLARLIGQSHKTTHKRRPGGA